MSSSRSSVRFATLGRTTIVTVALGFAGLAVSVSAPPLTAQEDPRGAADTTRIAASYTLQMESQSSEPWRWRVAGGARVVGVYSGESLEMLAGPELNGVPSTIERDWGLLIPALIEPPPDLESGEVVHTDAGASAYDSVRWDLTRGERDEAMDGREAEHWVLTVNASGRKMLDEDTANPFESTGRAELWFDPTLPFSAVPFAVARGSGFPLATMDPGAARFALREALPELRERGLLLRAEIASTQRHHMEGMDEPLASGPDTTVLTVSDIRPDGSPHEGFDAPEDTSARESTLDRYVRLDAERADALTMSDHLFSACPIAGGAMPEASSARGTVAGTAIEAGAVSAGAFGDEETACIVVTNIEAGTPEPFFLVAVAPKSAGAGNYQVTVPDMEALQSGAPQAGRAWVTVMGENMETGARSMLVAESGSLVLEDLAADRTEGSVTLRGWMVRRTPGADDAAGAMTTLSENAEVEISFVALPEG